MRTLCRGVPAAVVVLLALAACGGSGESTPETSEGVPSETVTQEEPEPVALTLWIADRVSADGMTATREVVADWEAETGNTVEVVDNSFFELMNKMPMAIPAGDGPDAFMLTNNYLGQFLAQDLIAPIELAETADLFTDGALASFTLGGDTLGVPLVADVNALVYNKELLPEIPATMDDLVDQALSLNDGDTYGLLFPADQFWWTWAFQAGEGGYIFGSSDGEVDPTDIGFGNEGSVAGLEYVVDMVRTKGLLPADTTADVASSLFLAGKAAAIITGPTAIPEYLAAGIDVGIAPIPALASGSSPRPFATYTGFSVSVESAHPDETADLLRYLGEHLPTRLQAASAGNISALAAADAGGDAQTEGWIAQLANSDPLPSVPEMDFVWGPAGAAVTQAVQGQADPGPALTEAVAAIEEALAAQE